MKQINWKQLGLLTIAGAIGGGLTLSGWLWLGPKTVGQSGGPVTSDSTVQPGDNGGTLTQTSSTVESAVKKVLPSVVSITSQDKVQGFFGGTYNQTGGGSGFVVRKDGLIVTNKHVVSSTTATYTVTISTGKTYSAQVVSRDPAADLALVKINVSNLIFGTNENPPRPMLYQALPKIGRASCRERV